MCESVERLAEKVIASLNLTVANISAYCGHGTHIKNDKDRSIIDLLIGLQRTAEQVRLSLAINEDQNVANVARHESTERKFPLYTRVTPSRTANLIIPSQMHQNLSDSDGEARFMESPLPIDATLMDSLPDLVHHTQLLLRVRPFQDHSIRHHIAGDREPEIRDALQSLTASEGGFLDRLYEHTPLVGVISALRFVKNPTFFTWAVYHVLHSQCLRRTIMGLRNEDATHFLDFLQGVADNTPPKGDLHRKSVQCMRKLSRKSHLLPSSMELNGDLRLTGSYPVAGGGFADIWKGELNGHGKVAVKTIRLFSRSPPAIEKAREAFFKQAIVWRQLKSPNVLKFFGVSTEFAPLCLAFAWMENGNVMEYLMSHPNASRIKLVHETAHGLAYLHENNIVHGDIKGGNVLVDDQGNACISDFGLSMIMQTIETTSFTSTTTWTQGSVRWMAPELLYAENLGSTNFTPTSSSDVYAFACFILEVMTGYVPFYEIRSDAIVITKLHNGARPDRPISHEYVERGLTDALWGLIGRCWVEAPNKRPSMPHVLRYLETINYTD